MTRVGFSTGLFLFLLLILDCSTRQIRTNEDLTEATKRAAAEDKDSWDLLEKSLNPQETEPNRELQKKVLAEIGKIPSENSQRIIASKLRDPALRTEAASALIQQRNGKNNRAIDQALIESTQANIQQYGFLTVDEIVALGEVDDPRAVEILKSQSGKDLTLNAAVIESLGKIMRRQMHAQVTGNAFGANTPKLSFEDPEQTSKNAEPATGDSAEKALLEILASDAPIESKRKAADELYTAYSPGARSKLLKLMTNRKQPFVLRTAILDYLTQQSLDRNDRSMLQDFVNAKKQLLYDKNFIAELNVSLKMLAEKFEEKSIDYHSVGFVAVSRNAVSKEVITISEKPLTSRSAGSVRENLKLVVRHYHLPPDIDQRIEKRLNDLLNADKNSQSADRNLLFAALRRLYPNEDFYVLKSRGQKAIDTPGYFSTTLRLVTASKRSRDWQVVALQRLWNLNFAEADKIRQIYLRDGKLLSARLRL